MNDPKPITEVHTSEFYPDKLPFGIHEVTLTIGGTKHSCRVASDGTHVLVADGVVGCPACHRRPMLVVGRSPVRSADRVENIAVGVCQNCRKDIGILVTRGDPVRPAESTAQSPAKGNRAQRRRAQQQARRKR